MEVGSLKGYLHFFGKVAQYELFIPTKNREKG